jgi:hypothetical protein
MHHLDLWRKLCAFLYSELCRIATPSCIHGLTKHFRSDFSVVKLVLVWSAMASHLQHVLGYPSDVPLPQATASNCILDCHNLCDCCLPSNGCIKRVFVIPLGNNLEPWTWCETDLPCNSSHHTDSHDENATQR